MKLIFATSLIIFITQIGFSQNKSFRNSKRFPAYQPDTSNHERKLLIAELNKYIQENFRIKDSTIISNNSDGESFEYSVTYKLNHGHIYGHGGEYEGFNYFIRFHKVPTEGVHKLINSIFEQIEIIDREAAEKVSEPGWHRVPMEELCCMIEIKAEGKDTTISITNSD